MNKVIYYEKSYLFAAIVSVHEAVMIKIFEMIWNIVWRKAYSSLVILSLKILVDLKVVRFCEKIDFRNAINVILKGFFWKFFHWWKEAIRKFYKCFAGPNER